MRTHNLAGDVLTQILVNAICNEINKLDLLKRNDLSDKIQEILSYVLRKPVKISSKYRRRQFPQLYRELQQKDIVLYIIYFIQENSPGNSNLESVLLQISIAAVLACCPYDFVEESVAIEENFRSFSQKWPAYANMASQIYNLLLTKITPR